MLGVLVALIAMSSASAPAQPSTSISSGPEIIVRRRVFTSSDISKAVRSIGQPVPIGGFDDQYPRWRTTLCVAIVGMPVDAGRFIADQIGVAARDVGLKTGAPGCQPNAFILFTAAPAKLIARARIHKAELVSGVDPATLSLIGKSSDAVRWIGSVELAAPQGGPALPSDSGIAVRPFLLLNRHDGGSRITDSAQTFLERMTVIVDTRQIEGIAYGQLSAYLALATLAELNPHAVAPNVDSILSLFPRSGHAPNGLTTFDKAYLKGLYDSNPEMPGVMQRSSIIASVRRTLNSSETPPTAP